MDWIALDSPSWWSLLLLLLMTMIYSDDDDDIHVWRRKHIQKNYCATCAQHAKCFTTTVLPYVKHSKWFVMEMIVSLIRNLHPIGGNSEISLSFPWDRREPVLRYFSVQTLKRRNVLCLLRTEYKRTQSNNIFSTLNLVALNKTYNIDIVF